MIMLKIKGVYHNDGRIVFDSNKQIEWDNLTTEKPPDLPHGSPVELKISFDEHDFLSGKEGIVWATYDLRQAEIIQNSLLAQDVNSEVKKINLLENIFFTLKISNETEVNDSINFIWKGESGLRLKPDWSYPAGETNKSFEQWLNGH